MPSSLPDVYQDHVLNAPDCCSNCFRYVREHRDRMTPSRFHNQAAIDDSPIVDTKENSLLVESHYAHRRDTVSAGYTPDGNPTNARHYFCECGTGSSFERHWDDVDVAEDRFTEFLRALAKTLLRTGVSVTPQTMVSQAFAAFRRRSRDGHAAVLYGTGGPTVDEALAAGLTAGLATAASGGASRARSD